MTYLYYKTSTLTTGNQKPSKKTIEQWEHLATKGKGLFMKDKYNK